MLPRYKERPIELSDDVGRFEAKPSSHHARNALGIISLLREEGTNYWGSDSRELRNWERYCTVLWNFINELSDRRDLKKQSLETAMREYIQEYEHSRDRLNQLLYGAVDDPESNERMRHISELLHWTYLTSTYALVSYWIGDKQEHVSVTMTINLTTGEHQEEWNRDEMRVPRKYKRATKRI